MIRENIDSVKKIKKNQYSVKKDINSLSSDLKKLKEEHIYSSDKRVKVRSIVVNNLAKYRNRFNRFNTSSLSKINACTRKDRAIVKN